MFFNLCSEAQGEIRNWFSSHLKERKDGLGERHALFSGRWKVSLAGVNHLFCWPLKKTAKPNRFSPLCEQLSFLLTIFLCLFFNLCNSVTFSSFFFFCFSFCSVSRFFVFFYSSSSLHMGSENSKERQTTSLGLLGQQPVQPSHQPSP